MGKKSDHEARLDTTTDPSELFDVAVDAQEAFAKGELTWQEEQNLMLRAMMKAFDPGQTEENN